VVHTSLSVWSTHLFLCGPHISFCVVHTSLSVWSKAKNEKKQDGSTYLGIKLSTISWAVFLHLHKMCVECIQTLLELKAGPRISFVIFNLLMALV
jgi:hypothetical protein